MPLLRLPIPSREAGPTLGRLLLDAQRGLKSYGARLGLGLNLDSRGGRKGWLRSLGRPPRSTALTSLIRSNSFIRGSVATHPEAAVRWASGVFAERSIVIVETGLAFTIVTVLPSTIRIVTVNTGFPVTIVILEAAKVQRLGQEGFGKRFFATWRARKSPALAQVRNATWNPPYMTFKSCARQSCITHDEICAPHWSIAPVPYRRGTSRIPKRSDNRSLVTRRHFGMKPFHELA
jgi:hypothetical protein